MTGSAEKIQAFIDFAMDTEGMKFTAKPTTSGKWKTTPAGDYDPQVIAAVKRAFNEDWELFSGM